VRSESCRLPTSTMRPLLLLGSVVCDFVAVVALALHLAMNYLFTMMVGSGARVCSGSRLQRSVLDVR
jgi:hypothetical protein